MMEGYIFEYTSLNFEELLYPEQFFEDFSGCAMYAQGILRDKPKEEIVATMRDLDIEINNRSDYDFSSLHFLNQKPKLTFENCRTCTNRYGIISLTWMQNNNDMSSLMHKSTLTWAEIYSIYALGLIAYTCRDLAICESSDELNEAEYLIELAGYYLAEVVEATTIARMLVSDDSNFIHTHELRAKIAKSGGIAKNEKYRILEKVVLEEYMQHHTQKSNSQASIDIWRKLSPNMKLDDSGNKILKEHNANQTIARWIAKLKRQKNSIS